MTSTLVFLALLLNILLIDDFFLCVLFGLRLDWIMDDLLAVDLTHLSSG